MMNSNLSTACSSPNNDSVERIIRNDQVRYQRKGYGLIFSALITVSYFALVPTILKEVFPLLGLTEDDKYTIALSLWCTHVGFNFFSYCVSYLVYTAKNPFLERYRIIDKPWPWESNPKQWKVIFKKTCMFFIMNQCIITPILLLSEMGMNGVFVSISPTNLPDALTIILQCSFCMIVDDFFFYWGHRLLHHPKLYPHIHKIHHQWNHTVIISNEYSHPLEYTIANLPAAIGPKILGKRMHLITLWMWIIMRVGESLDSHCGYEFSWSPYRLLPLSGSTSFHDYHHSTNVGNYGSYFTFWDTIFKTNKSYFSWLAKREKEAILSQVREGIIKIKEKASNCMASKQAMEVESRAQLEPEAEIETKKIQ